LVQLTAVAGVSPSYLKSLFRRSLGMPVHQYVIQRRVDRARALLSRGKLPPSQVAFEAGFAHQSHMARSMKRVLGVTPSEIVRSAH
jgi:AraC family transcriptional regulator